MVAMSDNVGAHARDAKKYESWATVKAELRDINGQWLSNFHASSVTFRHRRLGHSVKVTLNGEVFIDLRIRDGEYKSTVHRADLKSAAAYTRRFLQEHV